MAKRKTPKKVEIPKDEKEYLKEKEKFYVGIQNSVEIKKNLLLASKDLLMGLKSNEKIKAIRKEKAELMINFNENIREISTMITKIKNKLPNIKIRHLKVEVKKERTQGPAKKTPEKVSKARSELERLEKEIEMIEQRIKSLS